MSAPRKCDGLAPRHRQSLPRNRTRKNFAFRAEVYSKLTRLIGTDDLGRSESETEVIERLILSADEVLPARRQ